MARALPHGNEAALNEAAQVGAVFSRSESSPWQGAPPGADPGQGGDGMLKVFKCGDVMPGCTAILDGRDETEVMRKLIEHTQIAHGMATVPPEVAGKVRAAIQAQ
jgi:predicted small metal-binding protein